MNKNWLNKQISKELNIDKLRPLKEDDCILISIDVDDNGRTDINRETQYNIMKSIADNTKRKVIMLPSCLDVLNISKEDYDVIKNIIDKYNK